jgi:hypothetical protein
MEVLKRRAKGGSLIAATRSVHRKMGSFHGRAEATVMNCLTKGNSNPIRRLPRDLKALAESALQWISVPFAGYSAGEGELLAVTTGIALMGLMN